MLKVEILRTNGQHEAIELSRGSNVMREIAKAIGAETLDTVNLRDGRVMVVDDAGWNTETIEHSTGRFELRPTSPRRPLNHDATQLYLKVCRPGTTHQIAGDAAILWDRDLAGEGE